MGDEQEAGLEGAGPERPAREAEEEWLGRWVWAGLGGGGVYEIDKFVIIRDVGRK